MFHGWTPTLSGPVFGVRFRLPACGCRFGSGPGRFWSLCPSPLVRFPSGVVTGQLVGDRRSPGATILGARLRTPSANHRLLGPPTGPEVCDGSFCGQCTRWQVQYSQTGATLRRHFSRAVAAASTFVSVVAATSAWCRGTSQQNIASQVFPLLPTLRRHVSRPVAAGVYLL